MNLYKQQLSLLREAGVKVPDDAQDDSFMTGEDDEALADFLINSLGPGQEMTTKAYEVQALLNYLAG